MPALGLVLDALTLTIVIAFFLSGVVALLPEPKGDAGSLSQQSLIHLFLPPLGALAIVALGFWPATRAAMGGAPDHCLDAAARHPHLCWAHGMPGGSAVHDFVVLLVLATGVTVALWLAFQWAEGVGRLKLLRMVTDPEREAVVRDRLEGLGLSWPGPLQVIGIDLPLCFVMGWRQPRLILSTMVLDDLSSEQFAAVVAHERAHLERRDNVWRLIGRLASLAHFPGLGRRAYRRWTDGAEIACDDMASVRLGSRLAVADALVRYQRLLSRRGAAGRPRPALGVSFAETGTLERRIRFLLEPPVPARSMGRHWPWVLLPVALWQVETIHQALEVLLAVLHG